MARKIKVRAGRTVHIVSICWASSRLREESLLLRRAMLAQPTMERMSTRTVMAWS